MLRRISLIAGSAAMVALSALPASAAPTARGVFASGAVVVASNSAKKFSTNLGAVAFGYHHSICRNMTLRSSTHVKIYTFTANNKGQINHRSKTKKLF